MAARPISFAVDEADIPLLEELSLEFAGGNRSEFLRAVLVDYKERLRRQRIDARRQGMEELHAQMLKERGGKVYSTEETLKMIDENWVP